MAKNKLVAKGAEAYLYATSVLGMPALIKHRPKKKYRIEALDTSLRSMRTKKEAKLLAQAKSGGVSCPVVYELTPDSIVMARLPGRLLSSFRKPSPKIMKKCGAMLAQLHSAGIAHGDYTPANIIVHGGGVAVIDFGLGSFSGELEEKATDVLLMKRSLAKNIFSAFADGYRSAAEDYRQVFRQVDEIEKRGRYVVRGALA